MTTQQRVRYEMFLRVRDFGTTYRDRFPESSKAGKVFGKVAEAVTQIEAQGQTRAHAFRDGRKGKAEARAAVLKWTGDVVRSARDVSRTGAGSNARLQMPVRRSDVGVLEAARVLLDAGKPFSADFIELGLPADWETAFKTAIDAFEQRLSSRRAGRTGVASAGADIKAGLATGFSAIRTLDTIVANTLKTEPAMMAAWLRSRQVVEGKARPNGEPSVETAPDTASGADASAAATDDVLKQAS